MNQLKLDIDTSTEFYQEFKCFLEALSQKNWQKFANYFSDELGFMAVLIPTHPYGPKITTMDELYYSHQTWFEGKHNLFEYKIHRVEESDTQAFAEIAAHVRIFDAEGNSIYNQKTCIIFYFRKSQGQWYFVFDHNRLL